MAKNKKVAGIDPGLAGAVASYDGERVFVFDMPVLELARGGKNKRELDAVALSNLMEPIDGKVFVEQVGAMPGQGVTSMFSFGRSFGIVLGILASYRLPTTLVHPKTWKKALSVRDGKDGARLRASELMPGDAHQWALKKHDGRAEAALIAYYGFHLAA